MSAAPMTPAHAASATKSGSSHTKKSAATAPPRPGEKRMRPGALMESRRSVERVKVKRRRLNLKAKVESSYHISVSRA